MIKSLELKGPSCLTSAAADEPIFVLRANDEVASDIVRLWASSYKVQKNFGNAVMSEAQVKKYREALALADQMDAWRNLRAKAAAEAAAQATSADT
jgi:hypothetical protein